MQESGFIKLCSLITLAVLTLFSSNKALSQTLTCGIDGTVPIPSTNTVTFQQGSNAWATVGIDSTLGGIATELDLINPATPGSPLPLIDNRSAGGAAWQITYTTTDNSANQLAHYNQSAGNSDHNWGYQSNYSLDPVNGIRQLQWLPLESNDYRTPANTSGTDYKTSPCGTPGVLSSLYVGDAYFTITPAQVPVGSANLLRLTRGQFYRASGNQNWDAFDVDEALYLRPDSAINGNLRVYVAQLNNPPGTGTTVVQVPASGAEPTYLSGTVYNVYGTSSDWGVTTNALSYAVLVYTVAGVDIGIAIHRADGNPFYGIYRYRANVWPASSIYGTASYQFHYLLKSGWDPSLPTSFTDQQTVPYVVQYDIAPVDQLAAEGFPIS